MKKKSEMHSNCPDLLNIPADSKSEDSVNTEKLRPEENTDTVIYGSPEVSEIDDDFDPRDNRNEVIYGPPEVFGFDRSSDPFE